MDIEYYQPFYCEENIWQLCRHKRFAGLDKKVTFISNPTKTCALWRQKRSAKSGYPVIWDYHVILLVREGRWLVWDLDSSLPPGLGASEYIDATFEPDLVVPPGYSPMFNIIDSDTYLANFYSDRSHMLDRKRQFKADPPPWPAIMPSHESRVELATFVEMTLPGRLNLQGFKGRYCNRP